jgi:hypothetical protein
MAQGQAPQQGVSVAAAQNVFVKAAASSSKEYSNNIKSSNSALNAANDGQIYASGALNGHPLRFYFIDSLNHLLDHFFDV